MESLVANVSEVGYTVIHARRRWNRTRQGAQTKERRFAWLGKTTWILELAKALVAHGIQCIRDDHSKSFEAVSGPFLVSFRVLF